MLLEGSKKVGELHEVKLDRRQSLDHAVYHKNSNKDFVSYFKERNNAICSNMDGPRDCHTD